MADSWRVANSPWSPGFRKLCMPFWLISFTTAQWLPPRNLSCFVGYRLREAWFPTDLYFCLCFLCMPLQSSHCGVKCRTSLLSLPGCAPLPLPLTHLYLFTGFEAFPLPWDVAEIVLFIQGNYVGTHRQIRPFHTCFSWRKKKKRMWVCHWPTA